MSYLRFIRRVGFGKWARRWTAWQFYKRVLKRDPRLRLPNGRTIVTPRYSHPAGEAFVTAADVDWGSEALFRRALEPGGILVDAGAHIGYYTAYCLDRVEGAICFEPAERNREALEMNAPGCDLVFAFVGESTAEVPVCHGGPGFCFIGADAGRALRTCWSIDDYLARSRPGGRVCGIKIDVDGVDLRVARGARRTIETCRPVVLSEVGHDPFSSWEAFYHPLGYRILAFHDDGIPGTFGEVDEARFRRCKMLFCLPDERVEEVAEMASDLQGRSRHARAARPSVRRPEAASSLSAQLPAFGTPTVSANST